MRNFKSQLRSLTTGAVIATAGGVVYVTAAGGTAKASLLDADGAALANPLTLTRGGFDFNVADTVTSVDLYILSPTGHMVVAKGVKPSGDASIMVDTGRVDTTLIIPFNAADQTGGTEKLTGFVLPGAVQPNVAVDVVTIDATETIDVGTDSGDSGDANGFMDTVSVGTAGYIKPTLLASGDTMGALLSVLDSANAGDDAPEQDVSMIGKEVSYTLTAGSDTAAGFIVLPMQLRPSLL